MSSWRSPWPSIQPDWHDPPWAMRGRAVTAWFDAPRAVVAQVMSPDLVPPDEPTIRSRLRFYDLEFTVPHPDPTRPLAARTGAIREGALAFAAVAGPTGMEGEVSAFLWADSEDYMIWGREAFGWPIRRAEFEFEGSLWSEKLVPGAQGSSRLSDSWGTAALLGVTVGEEVSSGTPRGCWLTPRRVYRWGDTPEIRELLAVRPVVRDPGFTYSATGRAVFDFRAPHPVSGLTEVEVEVHVADGFELLVGADASVVPAGVHE